MGDGAGMAFGEVLPTLPRLRACFLSLRLAEFEVEGFGAHTRTIQARPMVRSLLSETNLMGVSLGPISKHYTITMKSTASDPPLSSLGFRVNNMVGDSQVDFEAWVR